MLKSIPMLAVTAMVLSAAAVCADNCGAPAGCQSCQPTCGESAPCRSSWLQRPGRFNQCCATPCSTCPQSSCRDRMHKLFEFLTYRQQHVGFFCHCSDPCCVPEMYTFFLDSCCCGTSCCIDYEAEGVGCGHGGCASCNGGWLRRRMPGCSTCSTCAGGMAKAEPRMAPASYVQVQAPVAAPVLQANAVAKPVETLHFAKSETVTELEHFNMPANNVSETLSFTKDAQ